jgi:CO dehydrogenase nickel-insertion accessory protein CooC1
LAANAGMQHLYLVGNRIMNETQKEAVTSFAEKNGLSILTFIPFDVKVIEADTLGETPLKNKEISAVRAIDNICDVLLKKVI